MKALIGHTGFVGMNIASQCSFNAFFNSKNIAEIRGRKFDLIVCSGAPAAKWIANQKPDEDLANLQGLMNHLSAVRAERFVLISTIDVYKSPLEVNEDTPIETDGLHAYGRHRYLLEVFARQQFDAHIIRLPGLFGPGLKKNIIFDFIHKNRLDLIHQDGVFQFYGLSNMWCDIDRALEHNIKLLNISSEPITVRTVAQECFDFEFKNSLPAPGPRYDYRSKYDKLWGGQGGYLYSADAVLRDMKKFVRSELSGGD